MKKGAKTWRQDINITGKYIQRWKEETNEPWELESNVEGATCSKQVFKMYVWDEHKCIITSRIYSLKENHKKNQGFSRIWPFLEPNNKEQGSHWDTRKHLRVEVWMDGWLYSDSPLLWMCTTLGVDCTSFKSAWGDIQECMDNWCPVIQVGMRMSTRTLVLFIWWWNLCHLDLSRP